MVRLTPAPAALSRRRLLAGFGIGTSALLTWLLSPLVRSEPLPSDRPAIVGHRGAEGLAPPNTRAAIRRALEVGVDGVELDVWQTRDGELILFHDAVLDWDSTGQGWIENTDWAEIRGARIDGEPLITLSDGLEELVNADVDVYLEVKESGFTDAILETVADYGLLDRLTVISFDADALEPARNADVSVGLVGSAPTSGLVDEAVDCGASVAFSHYAPQLIPRFIERTSESGLEAGIWKLVDTEHTVHDALEAGPDVLVTNRPDYALEFLERR